MLWDAQEAPGRTQGIRKASPVRRDLSRNAEDELKVAEK